MRIIDGVKERGGFVSSFLSVCGGLPSPEAADNPLKYKFSWSPKGVISASQNGARYRWEDQVLEVSLSLSVARWYAQESHLTTSVPNLFSRRCMERNCYKMHPHSLTNGRICTWSACLIATR
jgi:Saccharopine dehydrogenase C-terminal domain